MRATNEACDNSKSKRHGANPVQVEISRKSEFVLATLELGAITDTPKKASIFIPEGAPAIQIL